MNLADSSILISVFVTPLISN